MTEANLLPCPFCGCKDVNIVELDKVSIPQYMAVCYDCRARSAIQGSEQRAATAWNRRMR